MAPEVLDAAGLLPHGHFPSFSMANHWLPTRVTTWIEEPQTTALVTASGIYVPNSPRRLSLRSFL